MKYSKLKGKGQMDCNKIGNPLAAPIARQAFFLDFARKCPYIMSKVAGD